ncbi:MAG: hypothetical protein QG632_300, partial [Candidatus Dependentiae bacterium]|nr:hypothetical protein [Candidatus Dependentiae bacterium]
ILQHEQAIFQRHSVKSLLLTYLQSDAASFAELQNQQAAIQKKFSDQVKEIYFPDILCTPAFTNQWNNFIKRPLVAPPHGDGIEATVQSVLAGALMYKQIAIEQLNSGETAIVFRLPLELFERNAGLPNQPIYLCGVIGNDQNYNLVIIFHMDATQKGIFNDSAGPFRPQGVTACNHPLFAGASKNFCRTSTFNDHVNEPMRIHRVANAHGKAATDLLPYSQRLASKNPRSVLPANYIRDGKEVDVQYCVPLYEEGAASLEPQAFCTLKAMHPPLLTTTLSCWQTFQQMLTACPYRQKQFATLVTNPWDVFCATYPYVAPTAAARPAAEEAALTSEEVKERLRNEAILSIYNETGYEFTGYESDVEINETLNRLSLEIAASHRAGPFSISDTEALEVAAHYDIANDEVSRLQALESAKAGRPKKIKKKKK